jgi:MFS family permease
MAARLAVYVVFGANGALMGSWVPRIPEVKATIGLSPGVLGVALLAPAVGALLAMPFAGGLASRYGSAPATRAAAAAFFPLGATVGLASNAVTLFAALLAWGAAMGVLDVTMNAQAVTVERAAGRSLMSGFHATFSLGALLGAGAGVAAAELGLPVGGQLAGLGAGLLAAVLATSVAMLPDRLSVAGQAPLLVRPRGPQVLLAAAAFAVLLCEGATADWSAVYLRESLGAGPAGAGAAFAAFSATMTAGRLLGDAVLNRIPRRLAVRRFATVAALGLGTGLALARVADGRVAVAAAVGGFAVLGAGISVTFPALLAEAGATSARPAEAIGAVSTGGYLGFLVGPPVIGGVAELAGLPVALWLIPLLAASAAVLTAVGRRPPRSRSPRPPPPAPGPRSR